MEIKLSSLSPLSYEFTKPGDTVTLFRKQPNKREFRASIGAAVESILIFKGPTKIGMIPVKIADENAEYLKGKSTAKITVTDSAKKTIIIKV
jgi:hypothetical protein